MEVREYKGQEKVTLLEGEYKNMSGYVRNVSPYGWLSIVINGVGPKVSMRQTEVEFVCPNFFLEGAYLYKTNKKDFN